MAEILIIDDEEPVRFTIRSILEFGGYDVREASSGREALSVLRRRRPDMVLCDITMPEMTGYEVLKELRDKYPKLADLPFVFLSALAGRGDVLEGLRLGADDYVSKPIDHEMLLAKIEATLRQVSRIQEKKKREQVKLYKALTQKYESSEPQEAIPPPQPQAQPQAQPEAQPEAPPPADPPEAPAFEQRLEEILQRDAGGSAGQLRFINLAEIKERLGDRWPKVSQRVFELSESIIKKHLTPGAIYYRYNLEVFFLVFPDLPEGQAVILIESIADEICTKLLGQPEEGCRQLSLTSTHLEMKRLASACGTPTLGALAHAFDTLGSVPPGQVADPGDAVPRVKAQITVKYQPIWTPASEKVVAYQACGRMLDTHTGMDDQGDFDVLLAERVATYFCMRDHKAERAAVCLPIHLTSLVGEQRNDIKAYLDAVPPKQLKASLLVEVIVPPAAGDVSAVAGALAFVRRRCRFFAVRCSARHPQLGLFAKAGAASLSMQYRAPPSGSGAGKDLDLATFASETSSQGLEPFVHGLETLGSVREAVNARVRLMAGLAIAPEQDRPGKMQSLRRDQVLI